jgi:hypothetical protein
MSFGDAFKSFPVLQTSRLVLNQLTLGDAECYHHQQHSAETIPNRPPWTFGFEMESADHATKSIAFGHNAWKKKPA